MTNATISVSRKGDGWAVDVLSGGDGGEMMAAHKYAPRANSCHGGA